MSRSRLEEKIDKVQKDLDDAIKRKAYTEAGPLQDELEALVQQRKDIPTIEELQELVKSAEVNITNAAKNRDFAAAAALQADLDNAKKRLEAALEAANEGEEDSDNEDKKGNGSNATIDGIESRSDLERGISLIHNDVEKAIAARDYKKASELQVKVEELEKLRLYFPSLEDLEEQLRESKKGLEAAVSKKDFSNAGQLHEEIDKLEKKVQSERQNQEIAEQTELEEKKAAVIGVDGEKKTFDSRFALEEEIKATKVSQSEAIASKQFKKAESCQSVINELEKLRSALPTLAELAKQIQEKQSKMQQAISSKNFFDAEQLDKEIGRLEEKLASEKKKAPEQPSPRNNKPQLRQRPVLVPVLRQNASPHKASQLQTNTQPMHPVTKNQTSDVSVQSSNTQSLNVKENQQSKAAAIKTTQSDTRPVSKLRPKKPLISSSNDSVLSVTQMLASKRGDASLVVSDEGGLAGIITDTDITRRVVAKHLDPSDTSVSRVMTPNPTCVAMADSAMDAMSTMVENHFRHLPVVDENGGVVGLLDIAKCLNDAISKLENSRSKGGNAAEDALKEAMSVQGAQGAQALALQALLGPLMAQAFGNQSSPTLRSLLAGKPTTVVSPGTSVLEAGVLMAERRKAALVVDEGQLVGIFGFKDMMNRVVAKELPVDLTDITKVMTPNPEAVSPEMPVLEALQTMHDNKFLTLPVCEDDGTVVGLVDVMDVIYGCGGTEGWRSIFSSSLDLDDLSATASIHSGRGSAGGSVTKSVRSKKSAVEKVQDIRPVSKLRPKKPLISSSNDSVLSVTQMLASKRGDASLVVSDEGGLAGIITDTDITRRVVAKHLDPSDTSVSRVMTPNPTCVAMADSAMDAMSTMVENHFRHLPVVDENGGVVGLLDIAKCLNDAISKLENSRSKGGNAAEDALKEAMSVQGAQGAQALALQALLGPLMAQAFGNQSSPTLRSLLAGKPTTVVSPGTSVLEAGVLMAERRKAALVVDEGQLVGIFGFKDMMNRVVAKELPVDLTDITKVMTPNPEAVSPEMPVLEALQTMHDNKFLTLPVCEDDGTVVGLVDVMDVIYGCGGTEGWRSIFSSSLDLDDLSDTASVHSGRGSAGGSVTKSVRSKKRKDDRSVYMLRPKKPLVAGADESILSVTQMLADNRGDAAILVSETGGLAGIITDTDLTRRVVAKNVNPATVAISEVMTPDPKCVLDSDSAMEAMMLMVENHFRHLPVSDENGAVVGILDIAKCLNDAISKLEKSHAKGSDANENLIRQALAQSGQGTAALHALLGPLMSQGLGNSSTRTLRSILSGRPSTIVTPHASILSTAILMAENRKAALVVEDGFLVGIFGFKDMMNRVIAKELDVEVTAVENVMTAEPEFVSPDMTVLEALQTMHDNSFLTLPVCEEDGTIVGLVDVMDVIYGCGGAEGWRSVFDSALDIEDESASIQQPKALVPAPASESIPNAPKDPAITVSRDAPFVSQSIPGNIPMTLEFEEGDDFDEGGLTLNDGYTLNNDTFMSDSQSNTKIPYKILDPSGHTHRVRAEMKVSSLESAFAEKVKGSKKFRFKFTDDEGDAIMITSDEDLVEAFKHTPYSSKKPGSQVVKLKAEEIEESSSPNPMVLAGIGAVIAAIGIGAMIMLRPRK